MMSEEQALAFKIHCDLSDQQYQMIRNSIWQQNADIYPLRKKLLEPKHECYAVDIVISEIHAKVSLPSMLDHTLR